MARWPCIRSTTVVAGIRLAPRPNVRSSLIRLGERSAKWLRRCSVRTAHDDLYERVYVRRDRVHTQPAPGPAGHGRPMGSAPRHACLVPLQPRPRHHRCRRPRLRRTQEVPGRGPVDPWSPRGIEIRGEAEIRTTGGKEIMPAFDEDMFRIRPRRIVAWGIDGMALEGRDAADV